ncbi:hypothetical protein N7499_002750 [Penicillium canescens]|uniref:Uncharacterized protein n=1 Tax=Penicillium canescens TaxID=5083 RepID=A0AAD6I998_PENCN|nr:uncharacterized protein N7446_010386 [Penicillium canescens]KAJ6001337.1 hypothetical protein N7522_006564 [Penicillium canescens]KAJ6035625.1 hypothetical protein N7460_009800 [Penicillium canescens]KAJ6037747.1 hypothetical protein N7444_010452 [Penicillium canescens]KAJ6054374.1 hypothetical protein N7446_010386 [Penicillium canescens]KAJ6098376.1 hypothetical protein N7499_002750 [Penicillium canescens]
MCGESNRPTFGGTIAVLFPRENRTSPSPSEISRSSSPESISSFSSTSSTASMSSYSLFFRDTDPTTQRTKAIFRMDDTETYHTLRGCGHVDVRIEKYGDISNTSLSNSPLHQFRLEMTQDRNSKSACQTEMEFELPQRLDLGVSEKGVIGRQVTVREVGGSILGIGIVGYN